MMQLTFIGTDVVVSQLKAPLLVCFLLWLYLVIFLIGGGSSFTSIVVFNRTIFDEM